MSPHPIFLLAIPLGTPTVRPAQMATIPAHCEVCELGDRARDSVELLANLLSPSSNTSVAIYGV